MSQSQLSQSDHRRAEWERAYDRRQNFVFAPSEEVVRFVARKLRKRIGIDEFVDVIPGITHGKIFDAGCGIGRTLLYTWSMGLTTYGLDLSATAVDTARELMRRAAIEPVETYAVQGDLTSLPWENGFFDHAISDSTLDSMPASVAQLALHEIARVLKTDGLLYCSFISGDQTGLPDDFDGEMSVRDIHEEGTIQSYYNLPKIERLSPALLSVEEAVLIRREDARRAQRSGRWHVVFRRRGQAGHE